MSGSPAKPNVAPVITSTSPVVEQSPNQLKCSWRPFLNETVTYTWRKSNNNSEISSTRQGNDSVVRFDKVSRYNAGNYTCTVTTAGGSISGGPVPLMVHCK